MPFAPDGKPLPPLDLLPLFRSFLQQSGDLLADVVRSELERLLQRQAIGGW